MVFVSVGSSAHELTPTYFESKPSLYQNVRSVEMLLFNRRSDISYYELSAFDGDWNPIKFASKENIIKLKYLERKTIEIYFREVDLEKLTYICTKSLILKSEMKSTGISSRICSKKK
jgi:hypothetical protein